MNQTTRPKRIRKVLILGSGAIRIGQAGEFDYSGSQAIKALKEEGIRTVLINPNIATIQTSADLADEIYFVPIERRFIEDVLTREKPDGILLSFGGQTALNAGVELAERGVLKAHGVEVLGTPVAAIQDTEDRQRFIQRLDEIGLLTPRSGAVTDVESAVAVAEELGYPVMCRAAYALGGLGSGVARTKDAVRELARTGFTFSSQLLVEEYLGGWKELEYEVVRDRFDNCIVVCSMENVDPMGIHTGESIVVAPVQTLTARENFMLRSLAIRVVRHLGIVGECNIQFALSPDSAEYRIIEVNARLSRSSALASKATGYPLAFVATKLGLGYSLTSLKNRVTGQTSACCEPTLDYVVVKFPRWDLQKFKQVEPRIGSEMKSVGEVMAIARSFEEALQKAIRMLDVGMDGLVCNSATSRLAFDGGDALERELSQPTDKRMFAIAQALSQGWPLDRVHQLSRVDRWFLHKINNLVDTESMLRTYATSASADALPEDLLRQAKQRGFSDCQIARAVGCGASEIRRRRTELSLSPVVKQIDTMAAEYPAVTNYLYLTYNGRTHDVDFTTQGNRVIVLGGGPYRIGSSVEFDWCCVNAVQSLRAIGYSPLMVNNNPETVSTDYDICDKLYFDELTFERVCDICELENPLGVVVSVGGQIPNTLAWPLAQAGIPIVGTSPGSIDRAEDRHKFSKLLDELSVDQPEWKELTTLAEATDFSDRVGFPVLVRPSYVLSGAAMSIALSRSELHRYLEKASEVSADHPVVISKFLTDAKEIEIDAVADKGELHCYAISEHVENAGVHSGDATLVLPPQRTYLETMRRVKMIARKIARSLSITGPFNIQFIAKENAVKVIECNLRASRSVPFVSKVLGINFIDQAIKVMMGRRPPPFDRSSFDLDYVGVKAPQFSFTRLKGSDPVLGVEMVSTGEVACLGDDFNEAFLKSLLAVGFRIPPKNGAILLSTGPIDSKAELLRSVKTLSDMGYRLYATDGTARFLAANGIESLVLHWPLAPAEGISRCINGASYPAVRREPNTLTYLLAGRIDLVVNIPKNIEREELDNDYLIRRKAVDCDVPLITNLQLAKRFVEAISSLSHDDLKAKAWKEYL